MLGLSLSKGGLVHHFAGDDSVVLLEVRKLKTARKTTLHTN